MPLYQFKQKDNEDIILERFFNVAEAPRVGDKITDENGVVWIRIFSEGVVGIVKNGSGGGDPYSENDFVKKFEGKKVTIGDMFDESKERSIKRANKEGVDKVKQDYYDRYAKERKGQRHPKELRERQEKAKSETQEALKKAGISVTLRK